MAQHASINRPPQTGFSLIEVLVTLVIILVGLMGSVGLMVRTAKQEMESYQRFQALNLLQDMTARMHANPAVIACYSNAGNGINVGIDSSGSPITAEDIAVCTLGSAEQNSLANTDLADWNTALQGAAVQSADQDNIGAMIGARGCIEQISATPQVYRITIAWQGLTESAEAASDNNCGKNLYGADTGSREKLRRIVSTIIRIGDLS